MMTTARVTYASNSIKLMKLLYEHLFDVEGGKYITMGDVFVHAKQVGDENSKVYVYFGDPALRLNYPENIIELTSINNHDVIQNDTLPNQADTLRALQNVNIKGVVNDMFGTHLSDFNGVLHINVYDKDVEYKTNGNETDVYSFKLRNSVIYTGKAKVFSVKNGETKELKIWPKKHRKVHKINSFLLKLYGKYFNGGYKW